LHLLAKFTRLRVSTYVGDGMFYLVQSDVGTQIKATLTREDDGSAVDLRTATVRLKFREKGSTTVLFTLTSITASDDDKQNGIAIFQFSNGDLDLDEGKYEGEVEATFTNGSIESVFEKLDFYVRADF
jgi:hypothetical protein